MGVVGELRAGVGGRVTGAAFRRSGAGSTSIVGWTLAASPTAGAAMATRDLTPATFEDDVTGHDIVLVDFWAAWCGPCRGFAPVFEAASEQHPDVVFAKVDTEAERDLAAMARITSIPTLMAFREGILVFAQPGALPPAALEQLIAGVRGLDMDDVRRQVAAQEAADPGEVDVAEPWPRLTPSAPRWSTCASRMSTPRATWRARC